jgi:hypothetical protein
MYSIYFVSFFVATYLHVGDTFLGMPFGGFRGSFWTSSSSSVFLWMEFIRDFAKLVYSFINLQFTRNEYRCYKEKGSSLKAYFRDGWNFFDFFQIFCVWFLNCTEIVNFIVFLFCSDSLNSTKFENFYKKNQKNFELKIYQETMYSSLMIRQYNLETTLLCIIGPQIFIKWIQFARGNQLLGPFVRMIFKMAKDIFVFLIVFLVFLWGFAFAFFILQVEGFQTYFSSIINVFQMSLGQWEWENIRESGPLAILLFLIYVVIGTIMLLNLLIAVKNMCIPSIHAITWILTVHRYHRYIVDAWKNV